MTYKCVTHLVDKETGEPINYLGVVELQHRPHSGEEIASTTLYKYLHFKDQERFLGSTALFQIKKVRHMERDRVSNTPGQIDDTYLVIYIHFE